MTCPTPAAKIRAMPRPMLAVAVLLALLPAFALAQDAEDGSAGTVETRDGTFLTSAEDRKVMDADGTEIGEIEEILIDNDGNPAGFLVEMGGVLGIGDSDVAVPLEALSWNGTAYVSKMTQEQLEKLQPFDE